MSRSSSWVLNRAPGRPQWPPSAGDDHVSALLQRREEIRTQGDSRHLKNARCVSEIGLVASRDYVAKNRLIAKGLMQAYLEAIRDIKKNKEATLKVMAKYLRMELGSNRDILIDAYDEAIASDELERKPYPNRDGMRLAVELIAKQRNISPIPAIDNFIDTSLLEELDRSGFIDQLYR